MASLPPNSAKALEKGRFLATARDMQMVTLESHRAIKGKILILTVHEGARKDRCSVTGVSSRMIKRNEYI